MTPDERANIATLIGMLDADDPDERYLARNSIRNLLRSRVVEYRGRLYLSRCGELIVVENRDVVRVEDQSDE